MNVTRSLNLCVVGAGAAGLSLAAAAAMLGARVVLVDKPHAGDRLGHDRSLNLAALTAAGKAAHKARQASEFGVRTGPVEIDAAGVRRHIEECRARLAPNQSEARFGGFGVRVIRGTARFVDPSTIMVGERRIRARRFVVATGSTPVPPTLTGLKDVSVLTEDRPFDGVGLPTHLLILGGGPSAASLAQAHRRLGCAVTLIAPAGFLPVAEPDMSGLLAAILAREGVQIIVGRAVAAARADSGVQVTVEASHGVVTLEGSHLLVAGDRAPATSDLDLEAAGVQVVDGSILVDRRLRSSNPKIFAAGAVASVGGEAPSSLTQISAIHAGVLVKNLLFRVPSRLDDPLIAHCAACDPELAWVGLGEEEARSREPNVTVLRWPLYENERACAERAPDGAIKLLVDKRGKLMGAHILAPNAGDLIQPWAMAVGRRIPISKMASIAIPSPSLSELGKRAASSFLTPRLFTPGKRRIVKFLDRFG